MPNIEKFKKLTLGGLADRHGTPITNEEGVRYLLIEPERRKVTGVDTTINASNSVVTTTKFGRPGIDVKYLNSNSNSATVGNNNHNLTITSQESISSQQQQLLEFSQNYTASYVKDESSEDETPLVVSKRHHFDGNINSCNDASKTPGHKSILTCSVARTEKASVMRYWHTLGKCHLSPKKFKWDGQTTSSITGGAIKYNPDLGRAYYSKCSIYQNNEWTSFQAGDFVWRNIIQEDNTTKNDPNVDILDPHDGFPKLFRIISMFQAMKSYRGKWVSDDTCMENDDTLEDIQKRGHPYMVACPIFPIKKMLKRVYRKKENHNNSYQEVALGADCKNAPGRIFLMPLWIGEPDIEWKKIQVHVAKDNIETTPIPEGTEFVCSRQLTKDFQDIMSMKRINNPHMYLRPLLSDILSISNPMKMYSPKKWDESLKAEHVQFIKYTRRYEVEIPNHFYNTSDESDNFDAESEYLIKFDDDYDDDTRSGSSISSDGDDSDNNDNNDINPTPMIISNAEPKKISPIDLFKKIQLSRPSPEEILLRLMVQGDVDSVRSKKVNNQQTASTLKSHDVYIEKLNELIQMGMVENGLDYTEKLRGIEKDFLRDVSEFRPITDYLNVQKPKHASTSLQQLEEVGRENQRKKTTNEMFHDVVNSLRKELGYMNGFRYPQAHVCVSALFGLDIVLVAPTGHGKSLCFAVPALHKRDQITLVIEPLRAIIDDQVQKFKSDNKIKVEALKSVEDVLYNGGLRGEDLISDIANRMMIASKNNSYHYDGPIILFCTAELANSSGIKNQLKLINEFGKLNRIVLDEFDVAAEATEEWRDVYTHIIPTLRALVPNVPFTLLSATTCKKELLNLVNGLNDNPQRSKPQLFFHTRPISDSLIFSVERKQNDEIVAKRIQFILNSYEKMNPSSASKPKCICYCLTKSNCQKMNKTFTELGMNTEMVTSESGNRSAVVQRLKEGEIQMICATKALGRGVDISDIRFIFHTAMPCSMHDYVQETGRAGRDGVPSYCILFYRPQDQMKTEIVMRLRSLQGKDSGFGVLAGDERKKAQEKIKKTIKYASHAGDNMCRYGYLSSLVSVSEAVEEDEDSDSCLKCQEPCLCDLCSIRLGKDPYTIFPLKEENHILRDKDNCNKVIGTVQLKTMNINPLVKLFLRRFEEESKKTRALKMSQCNKLLIECITQVNNDVGLSFASLEEKIPPSFISGQFRLSIRLDLLRYLNDMGVTKFGGFDKDKYVMRSEEFFKYHQKISNDSIRFLLSNVRSLNVDQNSDATSNEQDFVMRDVDTGAASTVSPLDSTMAGHSPRFEEASKASAIPRPMLTTNKSAPAGADLLGTTIAVSPANVSFCAEIASTPVLPTKDLEIEDEKLDNFQTIPNMNNCYNINNNVITPSQINNKTATNFLDSLSYPKRTAEEVREAREKRDMGQSMTTTLSKQNSLQYAVNFESNVTSANLLSATARRDNNIKSAIARNYQGMYCPRLKMFKELIDVPTFSTLPFLVQYELYRLYNQEKPKTPISEFVQIVKEKLIDISWDWHNDELQSCRFLNESANTIHHMTTYNHILKIATDSNISPDEGVSAGSLLYFSASFGANGTDRIVLRPPEATADRRIYRKYGSHRFLEVHINPDVIRKHIQTLLHRRDPLWICGRSYSFLWAKATKTPQSYVLFAESGVGIAPEDEMTVDGVRHWCLCPELNPDMTVGKEHKRMKLSFSKTTPSYVLPDHCLEVVDDIKGDGDNELTDGCGLISQKALNHVWNGYSAYDQKRSGYLKKNFNGLISDSMAEVELISDQCEFTSFQGRIGGFKGMWVLDKSLEGVKVICRESQLKYLLPMKSMSAEKMNQICNERHLSPDALQYDEFYDTVDICSWDKGPEVGKLNIRAVQLLEHRGVSIDYFKKRVDEGMEWIDKLKEGGSESLLLNLRSTHAIEARVEKAAGDMFDDDLLFRMAAVRVPRNEPVFANLIDQRVRREADSTRKKAKYPLRHCYQLRMFPDHTGLLEENEAFVAGLIQMYGKTSIDMFQDLVAMRSPAYFAGDLLKLKMVSINEIMRRSILAGTEDFLFFSNLHTGLILSTKGKRSRADMMSGGDFDGDKAWVCFDPLLTEQIFDCPPPITNSSDYEIKKSNKESELAFNSKIIDRVLFSWNFRYHQGALGMMSNTLDSSLDSLGFDSKEAKIIGREAFLQVDHPYRKRGIPENITKNLSNIKEPHWKGFKTNIYKSEKALGVIWDYVEEKINSVRDHNNQNFARKAEANEYIMYHIQKKVDLLKATNNQKGAEDLINLRGTMKKAAMQYNSDIHQYLTAHPSKIDEFDPLYWNWLKGRHDFWRKRLFSKIFDEELTLAAAVLYEQVWELSIEKSTADNEKVFKFAWHVAHDILTRTIGDGMARESGGGLPVCINRDIEKELFGRFKKK